MRRGGPALLVLAASLLLSTEARSQADGGGETLYRRYCANCHGADARGDGPDAALLAQKPRNLRDGVLQLHSLDELVERIRTGRRLSLTVDPQALAQVEQRTSELLEHLRHLARANWAMVERGWAVYLARCTDCHGPFGRPPAQLPPGVRRARDLASPDFQRSVSDAGLLEAVRHGRKGMPALVPQVSDSEARALRTFVRMLSPGFETYQRFCAPCHGDDGRGVRPVLGEAEGKPTVVFDRRYFQGKSEAYVREKIRHMVHEKTSRMPHFSAWLNEGEAKAIVEYLRGLP